ncbi:MAG: hypothetical protein WBP08_15280 [Saprospiraceae bacterium]
MKKFENCRCMLFLIIFIPVLSTGQIREIKPTISTETSPTSKGFWVVESNVKHPDFSIIRYYLHDNTLLNIEYIFDKKINIKSRKTIQKLNKKLELIAKYFEQDKLHKEILQPITKSEQVEVW